METEHIISMSAAVIALSALGVSVWQSVLNREYFRKSTKPHLCIDQTLTDEKLLGFTLQNNGLGPAIITDFCVLVDGYRLCSLHPDDQMEKAFSILGIDQIGYGCYIPSKQQSISTGCTLQLLEIDDASYSSDIQVGIEQIATSITFEIEYESIYGEKFRYAGNE
ncbi:hypothetical protein ACUALS_19425 [Vibrio sp. NH-7]